MVLQRRDSVERGPKLVDMINDALDHRWQGVKLDHQDISPDDVELFRQRPMNVEHAIVFDISERLLEFDLSPKYLGLLSY